MKLKVPAQTSRVQFQVPWCAVQHTHRRSTCQQPKAVHFQLLYPRPAFLYSTCTLALLSGHSSSPLEGPLPFVPDLAAHSYILQVPAKGGLASHRRMSGTANMVICENRPLYFYSN